MIKAVYLSLGFWSLALVQAGAACAAVTLSYWTSPNPDEVSLADELVAEWNRSHPEIQVRVQPIPAGASSEEAILAAVAAKTTPDLCSNILPAVMNRLTRAQAVVPINRFKDWKQVLSERIDERTLKDYVTSEGLVYQVPWKSNPVMLAYNVDVFRELKLAPPRTYDEFMRVASKLTRDTNGDGKIDHWAMNPSTVVTWWQRLFDFFPFYVAATSGRTLLRGDTVQFDIPESAQVLGFFAEGFKKGYFPNTGSFGDLFLERKAGMTVVGPWAIKYFERAMTTRFEYDFSPIPVPKYIRGPTFTYGDPKNVAIFSTTRSPEAAWEFVKFLISKKSDLRLLEKTFQIPIRKGIARDPFFADILRKEPHLRKFSEQAESISPMDDSPHIVQILDYLGQQYEATAVYGIVPPEKAVRSAAKYVQAIYKYW